MSAQTTPITERQLDLITRAHCDAGGLIEPLLALKGGAKLKEVATSARIDMEKLFDAKVFLEIWVKVKSGWADDVRFIKQMGLE